MAIAQRALTRREVQCLEGLARGLGNAEISRQLQIAMPTVALHLINARKKLGAVTREQAVALAIKRGILRLG
jgi:DNA-binding CsgD family transcriptional regulator